MSERAVTMRIRCGGPGQAMPGQVLPVTILVHAMTVCVRVCGHIHVMSCHVMSCVSGLRDALPPRRLRFPLRCAVAKGRRMAKRRAFRKGTVASFVGLSSYR